MTRDEMIEKCENAGLTVTHDDKFVRIEKRLDYGHESISVAHNSLKALEAGYKEAQKKGWV